MTLLAFWGGILLAGSAAAGTPREEAVAFTPEQAQEHAKIFCSRAGLVDVKLPGGEARQLCGSDREHSVIAYEDALDLLTRMNTEASRQAWVWVPSPHESITVFNLERSQEGFYQAPKVAFAVPASAFPSNAKEATVRAWLAKQEAVAASKVSPNDGALISWRQQN